MRATEYEKGRPRAPYESNKVGCQSMNLSQLYYFAKLSETEHFSNAAKELYITQPSLSHAIKSLETELGVQLFEREGRRMRLTPFGREFAECVKAGLREIDRGVELAHEFNGKLGGTVNIGAVFTVQGDFLPRLFCDYRVRYGQEVKLNMFQGFSIPLVAGLEEDDYDVCFAAANVQKPDLCYEHMLSHELVAFVEKSNPLAERESIKLEELKGRTVRTYRRGTPIGEDVADLLESVGVKATYDCADEISLGGVIASRPEQVGLATLTLGLKAFSDLAVIPIEDVPRDFHNIYLIYKKDAYRSRAVENFIEFASDWVAPAGVVLTTGYHSEA